MKYIITLLALSTLYAAEGSPEVKPQGGPPHTRPPHPAIQWDMDSDKALSKEEWLARAAARFDMLDANKDGKVTKEEAEAGFRAFMEKRKERREERREERKEAGPAQSAGWLLK